MPSAQHLTVRVELGTRSYPVMIGRSLLQRGDLFAPYVKGEQIMIISNRTVAPIYLDSLREAFSTQRVDVHLMPDGEQYKNFEELTKIYDKLLARRHERSTTLVALGGGVVGDVTGFAAATYQRGVNFIQVPTTLLAQVDSSVGGKTAVNHSRGKNMIGAFYQPRCVVVDLDTLSTLPDREFAAGLSEIIKYGLIADAEFYRWLQDNQESLLRRDLSVLAQAVKRSCEIKACVVAEDETECGRRAILNFGHTFGHAIETWTSYSSLLHGEAVAIGMSLAMRLSIERGTVSSSELNRLNTLLKYFRLPVDPPLELQEDKFLELMSSDKKVRNGRIRLVLLEEIGRALVVEDCDPASIKQFLRLCRGHSDSE